MDVQWTTQLISASVINNAAIFTALGIFSSFSNSIFNSTEAEISCGIVNSGLSMECALCSVKKR